MRGLLKMGMVAGLIVLFALAARGLGNWWAGPERHTAVQIVVDPPPPEEQGDILPLRAYVGLFAGRPRPLDQGPLVIDEDEVDLESGEPRFSLEAHEDDGTRFFLHISVEMADFDRYCEVHALPPMRVVEIDGDRTWVDARTRRPLPTLHFAPRSGSAC